MCGGDGLNENAAINYADINKSAGITFRSESESEVIIFTFSIAESVEKFHIIKVFLPMLKEKQNFQGVVEKEKQAAASVSLKLQNSFFTTSTFPPLSSLPPSANFPIALLCDFNVAVF
jgi:hypothetical protein